MYTQTTKKPKPCSAVCAGLVILGALCYLLLALGLVGCSPRAGEIVTPSPAPTGTVAVGSCTTTEKVFVVDTPNRLEVVDTLEEGISVLTLVEDRDGWTQVVTPKLVYGWISAEKCK